MAVAFRHLASIGFAENMAGHITWQPDGRSDMYVNPWGLWWQELTASDICVVDEDARVVRGRWDVTPAIHIHTEIHRHRPDARVVIHNHPYYVSLIAALGTLPELVHQTGALFLDDMYLVEKYDGEIDTPWRAAELATQIGSANLVILANHGVIATGNTSADCAPNNPATGVPYFRLPALGWGNGWATGNVLRFNTIGSQFPVWVVRTVQQGPESVPDDHFTLLVRGDVDTP